MKNVYLNLAETCETVLQTTENNAPVRRLLGDGRAGANDVLKVCARADILHPL